MSYSDEELKIDDIDEEEEEGADDELLDDSMDSIPEEDDLLDDEFIGLGEGDSDEY